MTTVCRGCGLPVHNTETCSQAKRKAEHAAKLDVGFPPMEPVGTVTMPEVKIVAGSAAEVAAPAFEALLQKPEKNSPDPLPTDPKIANVANEDYPKSLQKYRDKEGRREYMAKLMKKRRAAAKKAKGKKK